MFVFHWSFFFQEENTDSETARSRAPRKPGKHDTEFARFGIATDCRDCECAFMSDLDVHTHNSILRND